MKALKAHQIALMIMAAPVMVLLLGKVYSVLYSILFPCTDKYCDGSSLVPFLLTFFTTVGLGVYATIYFQSQENKRNRYY